MKSIVKYVFVVMLACTVASCDWLDVVPDNIATLDHAFADRYTAEMYLGTCYWGMPRSGDWGANPGIFGALEMLMNPERRNWGEMQFGLGLNRPDRGLMNYWGDGGTRYRSLYAGINDCNTFLANIERVKDLPPYEMKRWIAEVKLVKAFNHFFLIEHYGPICPLKVNTPVSESTGGVRVYRQKIDDCFAYVLELIDEVIASEALPVFIPSEATELGRFTVAAAYFLRAKVLTYWASPLFNGNTDYEGFKNHQGEPFFNQTPDPNRWALAAQACKDAIAKCQEAGHRLYDYKTDYATMRPISDTTKHQLGMRSAISERWNPELIWGNTQFGIRFDELQRAAMTRFEPTGGNHGGMPEGALSIPFRIVDKFYSRNGIPIENDPEYLTRFGLSYASRRTAISTRIEDNPGIADQVYYIQLNDYTAAQNIDREPRFYSTLGFDRGKWYGNSYRDATRGDKGAEYVQNRWGENSAAMFGDQYNATGYLNKKIVSLAGSFTANNNFSSNNMDYPFPDMRYADLLLLTAETLNESDAPAAEVLSYVDQVRERAKLKGVVESWAKSTRPSLHTTKEGRREIIHRERTIEFIGEGWHYWDIRRWKTASRELNGPVLGWSTLKDNVQDYYTVNTVYSQAFNHRDYFSPIPDQDIINNPSLIQNPGW